VAPARLALLLLALGGPFFWWRLDVLVSPLVAQAYGDTVASATYAWHSFSGLAGTSGEAVSEVAEPIELPVIQPARAIELPATAGRPESVVYVPSGPEMPRTALVVLHGMGGSGPGIAGRVLQQAHERGWVVVAPTIPYGDWRDPSQLVLEELRILPQIEALLSAVPVETGVRLQPRVILFGFSRGAQAALRFATLFPDRVDAVAALSAGTYTLPVTTVQASTGGLMPAPMPFGIADLEERTGRSVNTARFTRVRFFIGVGDGDNRDGDVPRQWDPFVGKNRVERAGRFASILRDMGCEAQLAVIPGAGHEIVAPMVDRAIGFFASSLTAVWQAEQIDPGLLEIVSKPSAV
jgi:pimeloyl-ACP methyl ester carboxylesterase